jgi:hypothetical protein
MADEIEFLYHYTTHAGLYGILESQCLWASHYTSLNDYTECRFFVPVLAQRLYSEFIKSLQSENKLNFNNESNKNQFFKECKNFWLNQSKEISEAHRNIHGDEFYIASFSRYSSDDGLLSQWRAYGKDGGYALVFNKHKIEKLIKNKEGVLFGNVFYARNNIINNDEQKMFEDSEQNSMNYWDESTQRQMDEAADNIMEHIKYILEEDKDPSIDPDLKDMVEKSYAGSLKWLAFCKHFGFSEENEFRIICSPIYTRKFRDVNGRRIAYLELFKPTKQKTSKGDKSKFLDAIEKIIIGPHRDKYEREKELSFWLKSTDNNIDVAVSDIPYL